MERWLHKMCAIIRFHNFRKPNEMQPKANQGVRGATEKANAEFNVKPTRMKPFFPHLNLFSLSLISYFSTFASLDYTM